MSRIDMTGFEGGALRMDGWAIGVGPPVIENTIVHSGSGSLKASIVNSTAKAVWTGTVNGQWIYTRAWFLVSALPAAGSSIVIDQVYIGGSVAQGIKLDSNGRLSNTGGTVVLSSPITINQWFCVELAYRANIGVGFDWIGRLDGVEWFNFSQANTANTNFPAGLIVGWVSTFAGTPGTLNIYVDDVAINDDSGSYQNSWPGTFGKIVHMRPISDVAVGTGWTNNNGGAFSPGAYDCLNNQPPVGVAFNAASTPQNQIRNASTNQTDVDVNMESYSTAGLGSSDQVSVMRWTIQYGDSHVTQTRAMAAKLVSNPAEAAETTLTTPGGAAGTWGPAGSWSTGGSNPSPSGPCIHNPTITKGTSPVLRIGKRNTLTDSVGACYAALEIEYAPSGGSSGTRRFMAVA